MTEENQDSKHQGKAPEQKDQSASEADFLRADLKKAAVEAQEYLDKKKAQQK